MSTGRAALLAGTILALGVALAVPAYRYGGPIPGTLALGSALLAAGLAFQLRGAEGAGEGDRVRRIAAGTLPLVPGLLTLYLSFSSGGYFLRRA